MTETKPAPTPAPSRLRVAGRRWLMLGMIGMAIYYAVWGGEYTTFDMIRLRKRSEEAAAQLEAARHQVDSLRAVRQLLETDSATIERVAREKFGMIREGELLYRFVEVLPPDRAPPVEGPAYDP